MTDQAVPIAEIECMIAGLGQEVSGRAMMAILSELDEEMRRCVPASWRNVGREAR